MRAVPYIVSHHFTISICQSDKIGRFLLYTTMDASLTRSLASFAVCPWTHQAQGRRPRVLKGCPLSTFTHIADLPSRRGLSVSTASSSLRFTVPVCWQPSIFGCWPSGVDLPATGGYVGTISGDFSHSTQDVSVHRVVSWHSTDLTFLCLRTVCSGPSSVLNT